MRVICTSHTDLKDFTTKVQFQPTNVILPDGRRVQVGEAEVTDEAALAYFRSRPDHFIVANGNGNVYKAVPTEVPTPQPEAKIPVSASAALPVPDLDLEETEDTTPDGLDGLAWASTVARHRAAELGLTADYFEDVEPDSERGFTTAQVKRIARLASE